VDLKWFCFSRTYIFRYVSNIILANIDRYKINHIGSYHIRSLLWGEHLYGSRRLNKKMPLV